MSIEFLHFFEISNGSYQFCPLAPTREVQSDQRICFKLSSEVKTELWLWREVQTSFRLCSRRRSSQRPPFLSHRLAPPFNYRQLHYPPDEPLPNGTSRVETDVKTPQIFSSTSSKTLLGLFRLAAQRKHVLLKNSPTSNLAAISW